MQSASPRTVPRGPASWVLALRRVDERIVPRLRRPLQRTLRRPPGRLAALDARLLPPVALAARGVVADPARIGRVPAVVAGRMRAAEDCSRFRTVVVRVARTPQAVALLISVLILGAGMAHMRISESRAAGASSSAQGGGALPGEGDGGWAAGQVGPGPGTKLDEYVASRKSELSARAEQEGKRGALAVVSLESHQTPEAVVGILAGARVTPVELLMRIPLPEMPAFRVTVGGDAVGSARKAIGDQLSLQREQLQEFRGYAATTDDPVFKEAYEEDVARTEKAVSTLAGPCQCVYAVVVKGEVARLAALGARAGVRLVDLAPREAKQGDVGFVGIYPEDRSAATFSGRS